MGRRSGLLTYFAAAAMAGALLLPSSAHAAGLEGDTANLPRTAVVFTGQFDRIGVALDLLKSGRVDRLFISGVNPAAGLRPSEFSAQFALTADQAHWLDDGTITLAPDANTTLENALEAACWLRRQPGIKDIILITSRWHMARASVALRRAMPGVEIVRVSPDTIVRGRGFNDELRELGALAVTWAVTLLPQRLWPVERPDTCINT